VNVIRVFIADDHDMVRLGLRTFLSLESKIKVVGEAQNGLETVEFLRSSSEENKPDVILMDLMMPLMDGVEATKQVAKQFPMLKIIMLTSFLDDDKVLQAIEAGAVSYVLKTISSEQLVHEIECAYYGKPVMNTEISQSLARGLRQRTLQGEDTEFTQREKEVLLLISNGKSNKEIAEEMHISIKTVKTHVSNLLMKCELQDRTQLAIHAHRKGWAGANI